MFRDLNGDGRPDLYVCNDFFTPDRVWINQGAGVFRALASRAVRKTPYAAMAVDFADLDRDGHDDFVVTEMLSRDHRRRQVQHSLLEMPPLPAWGWGWNPGDTEGRLQVMRNTLSLNRGDGTYAEIAAFAGLEASEWTWGLAFCDVDLDGFEDLLVANGHGRDVANSDALAAIDARPKGVTVAERMATHDLFPPLPLPHLAFRNRGDLTFEDASRAWGFEVVGAANGLALADLDNDGDQDVVFNHLNGPVVLLRNDAPAPRIAVRLRGARGLTQGTGAKILVHGGPVPQSQEVLAGGRYLSGDDPIRVFAVGAASNLTVEVRWPGGRRSRVEQVPPNRLLVLDETAASPAAAGRRCACSRSVLRGSERFPEPHSPRRAVRRFRSSTPVVPAPEPARTRIGLVRFERRRARRSRDRSGARGPTAGAPERGSRGLRAGGGAGLGGSTGRRPCRGAGLVSRTGPEPDARGPVQLRDGRCPHPGGRRARRLFRQRGGIGPGLRVGKQPRGRWRWPTSTGTAISTCSSVAASFRAAIRFPRPPGCFGGTRGGG
jgi:hypothetical protein